MIMRVTVLRLELYDWNLQELLDIQNLHSSRDLHHGVFNVRAQAIAVLESPMGRVSSMWERGTLRKQAGGLQT